MQFKSFTYLIALILLTSCDKNDTSLNTSVYFGGQIINPLSQDITLMKGEQVLEKIPLDGNNSFLVKLDSIPEGLYSIVHGSNSTHKEFQYVYFEPNDSIILRLNTWDFDESLTFSGLGAEKNNFLAHLFLENEKDHELGKFIFELDYTGFQNEIQKIQDRNQSIYDDLITKHTIPVTDQFKELASIAIDYPVYKWYEIYSVINAPTANHLIEDENFYNSYFSYRERISLTNEKFFNYFPYINYIHFYIYSKAMYNQRLNPELGITQHGMNVIVDEVTNEAFKNDLLFKAIYHDFKESKGSCGFKDKNLSFFKEHCTDSTYMDRVRKLESDCNLLKDNTPLQDFSVQDDGKRIQMSSLIHNKNAVIYFWSPKKVNTNALYKRVIELKKLHPSVQFIGVNTEDETSLESSRRISTDQQYTLSADSINKHFIQSSEPRTILVNEKGIIVNSFTYLISPHIDHQISQLEK